MANLEIITGRTGEQHVLAIDDAEIYRTLLGNGDFILTTGLKFAAQMNGANKVDIYNGTAIMQGRQVKIRSGYQELETAAGVSGMKRQDAIIIEYEKDGDYDTVTLKVIKGANNASSYVPPVLPHVNGNIDLGEKHQMLLWYVRYDGINFSELIDMRTVLDTTPIQAAIDSATSAKAQIEADMTSYKAQIRQELDSILSVVKIAPLETLTWRNAQGIPDGGGPYNVVMELQLDEYSAAENTDVFKLYLNGLKMPDDMYTVRIRLDQQGNYEAVITVKFQFSVERYVTYDTVELEVWRPEEV